MTYNLSIICCKRHIETTTQSNNEKERKLHPFIKAYLYSYLIVFLIILILGNESPFLSNFLLVAFVVPLILPAVSFFTFLIDALYLFAIIIYGVILFILSSAFATLTSPACILAR